MHWLRNNILLVLAVALLLGIAVAIVWVLGTNDGARHGWHVLHLLIALKVFKWIAAGCLLAVLAIRRLMKSRKGETPSNPGNGAVVRLPGCAPAE